MICLASQFCIFANLHRKTPHRHNCGKWVPAKSCDLHKLLSVPHFPRFQAKPRFFFWEEAEESSVEIASLSYSGAFSFWRWCNRRLWPTPFAFLVPHQGTNWLGDLDPRRWLSSCLLQKLANLQSEETQRALTLQITKFLPETSSNWQMWSMWWGQCLVRRIYCLGVDKMKKENRHVWYVDRKEWATTLWIQN